MSTSAYMNLTLPNVSGVAGPTWATNLNADLTLIDTHDHTSGKGLPVPSDGLDIDADLTFGGYQATDLMSAAFSSQSAALAATYTSCLYVANGNLYYNNSTGTSVQLTSGSSISLTSVGGISGMTGTTATAVYSSGSLTFTWSSNTNVAALMDCGALTIHPAGTSTYGVTIVPNASISAAYTLTLPVALPASTLPLQVSATGAVTAATLTQAQMGTDVGTFLVAAHFNGDGTIRGQKGTITVSAATNVSTGVYTVAVAGLTVAAGVAIATTGAGGQPIVLGTPTSNGVVTITCKSDLATVANGAFQLIVFAL